MDNVIFSPEKLWSVFVSAGIFSMWAALSMGYVKRHNLLKNGMWQLLGVTIGCVLWDVCTGWRGWSVDYVFPSVCIGAMLAVIILSRVLRMPDRDYMIHLILCAVLGVVPLVFLFTGVLGVIAPSVICTAASLIVISLQLIFNWKAMYREIHKKLHL